MIDKNKFFVHNNIYNYATTNYLSSNILIKLLKIREEYANSYYITNNSDNKEMIIDLIIDINKQINIIIQTQNNEL